MRQLNLVEPVLRHCRCELRSVRRAQVYERLLVNQRLDHDRRLCHGNPADTHSDARAVNFPIIIRFPLLQAGRYPRHRKRYGGGSTKTFTREEFHHLIRSNFFVGAVSF